LEAVKKAINELRHEFRTLLPAPEVERNVKAEATLESIRKKLYAASYAAGGQGQDWLKLFKTVDKDKSGSLGFDEFRIAVRKGARLSPTVVSDIELKQIFTAMDVDGSKTIEAGEEPACSRRSRRCWQAAPAHLSARVRASEPADPRLVGRACMDVLGEFAAFLSSRHRHAEDAFGSAKFRMVTCPASRLLVLEGGHTFHPELVGMIDVAVFVSGPPQLSITRALASAWTAPKRSVQPCRTLSTLSGQAGPIQFLHGNRHAACAHVLVRNRWSPVVGSEQVQADMVSAGPSSLEQQPCVHAHASPHSD
jgi:hypothetical protein